MEDIKETDSGHYLTKMKLLYKKCMNYRSREDLGNEPLISLLSKIGGWPVIQGSGWNSDNFSLEETLITMRQTGVHHTLFSLYIDNEGWEEKDNHIVVSLLSVMIRKNGCISPSLYRSIIQIWYQMIWTTQIMKQ